MSAVYCNRSGAATSAAKVNRREGHVVRRIGYNEVSDLELIRLADQGVRHFWSKRNWVGVFQFDDDAAFRAVSLKRRGSA